MARITGYGQSGRIEWDRPTEFYFPSRGESVKAYMRRVLVNASAEEVELAKKLLEQSKSTYCQAFPGPLDRSITRREAINGLASYKKVFDINSIFEA